MSKIVFKEDIFEIYEDDGRFTLFVDEEYIMAFWSFEAARSYGEDEFTTYLPNLD